MRGGGRGSIGWIGLGRKGRPVRVPVAVSWGPMVFVYNWRPRAHADAGVLPEKGQTMTGAKIQPRLLEDVKDSAMRRAEAERYFSARVGPRATPARAKALMARLGTPGALRDGDGLDGEDTAAG